MTAGGSIFNPRATAASTVAGVVTGRLGGSISEVFQLLLKGEDYGLHGIHLLIQLDHKLIQFCVMCACLIGKRVELLSYGREECDLFSEWCTVSTHQMSHDRSSFMSTYGV